MKILRSFPEPGKIPPGRAYVADDLEKLYTPLGAGGRADFSALRGLADDVILVEWDVAVDRADMARFARLAGAGTGRWSRRITSWMMTGSALGAFPARGRTMAAGGSPGSEHIRRYRV